MAKYQIFTDSCSDMTPEMRYPNNIDYFRMVINVRGEDLEADLDYKTYSAQEIYDWIEDLNNKCKTSLIQVGEFIKRMRPYLEKGIDVFYIAVTSVLSGSYNTFRFAKEELEKEFPDRKIIAYNSTRAGMALGMMVLDAAKMQQEGKEIEDIIEYFDRDKQKYNLCGTLATLKYLKAAGRVSNAAAFFGDIIGIKPIIYGDTMGHNYVVKKVKGMRTALDTLVEHVKDITEGIEHPIIYLGQGKAQQSVDYLTKRFKEELGATVVDYWIGPVIGINCGPGVIHICCMGKPMTLTAPEE